ncbi:glycosyltransferase [Xanthomonas albilineans]|uniref:glycosyltransferase n=1 Tax=Xanthomonas albilineans TaxID=29447 RepID=UPI0006990561|nr:glycosyltransferase [Xanthomonas albilineans]
MTVLNQVGGITVIVPTYNCSRLLALTLDSLCQQSLPSSQYEVIVVDDGSTDDTRQVVDRYRDRIRLGYFFQDDLGFRAAAARNIGIRHSRFDVVLFIDSGVLVSSRLLAMHQQAHQGKHDLAVLGISHGVNEYDTRHAQLILNLMATTVDDSIAAMHTYPQLQDCRLGYLQAIDYDLSLMRDPWLIFWGGHVSVSRPALCQVRGFDEWFTSWGGEDVELGLRLLKAGCRVEMLRSVESIHYPHQRNAEEKRASSRKNVQYIHQKHGTASTRRLLTEGWEEIVGAQDALATRYAPVVAVHDAMVE